MYWPSNSVFISYLLTYISLKIGFKLANAKIHDDSYNLWWTENDRIRADTWFLRKLLIDSWQKKYKIFLAYIFYFSVRCFGKKYFNYNLNKND